MTSATNPPYKIFTFQDVKCFPDTVFEVKPECLSPSPVPIVVDNGSFQTRAGWACTGEEFALPGLLFKSVAARSRGAARSETQGHVEHPMVVTEAPCNPLHCRQMMSELLFECYGVPRLAYGVDSLFSFYYNGRQCGLDQPHTGLVLSSGYHCSHVLPFINGRLDAVNCKRINVGGSHAAAYMQRLLQLKYPAHQAVITPSRMEELLHHHCYVAVDYEQELEKWRSATFYEAEVHRMQLPFSGKVAGMYANAEEKQEKRVQQLRRLEEMSNRHREERLQQDQKRLHMLLTVQELEEGAVEQFHRRLMELNMDSAEELQSYIHKLSLSVEQQGLTRTEPVFNIAEYHQLFVGTERLRAPEVLFRPYLIGEEQMGLMEALQFVLEQYTPETQAALSKNIYLTGGNLVYPGVKERVERELLAIRPFQSHFKVSLASQPSLDAWLGAREWALRNPPESHGWISRQDYEEKGGEYLSEHCASNIFIPMWISKPAVRSNELFHSATEHTQDFSTTSLNTDVTLDPNSGISEVVVC
ncbi:Actin-related protein 5 [Bagarius yarrelli]|uniref:Actin-related protein 5 n=1 Tax=Bagarius yarrelli TaxID=175774 RepID=A0A556VCH6_BAGYA|nr:Actin-related protein 5 [Bagarius yarrelli]